LAYADEIQKTKHCLKNLESILEKLKEEWVFVEGKKDKNALRKFGIENIKTISGNLRISCNEVSGVAKKVVVLTDLDRKGEELAKRANEELESCSIKADVETRKHLAAILDLRCFEDMERKYEKFMEKVKELKIR
jgi:5S rRNA maturation endonuclease (ribonuclease M5)